MKGCTLTERNKTSAETGESSLSSLMLPGSITVAHSLEWLFERLCCLLLFVVVAGCCFCFWCCGCSQAPFLLCSEAPGEQVVSSQEDSLSAPERLPLFTVHSVVMPL